jgi:hypothetical protein
MSPATTVIPRRVGACPRPRCEDEAILPLGLLRSFAVRNGNERRQSVTSHVNEYIALPRRIFDAIIAILFMKRALLIKRLVAQ